MTLWPHFIHGSIHSSIHRPPCLLLHGWLGQKQDWLRLITTLQTRYDCVAVDLPGHGEHLHRPLAEPLTFTSLTQELHQVIQELGFAKPPVLIGYSLGGRLALSYALRFPHTLTALVLENCQPGISEETHRLQRQQADQMLAQQLLTLGIHDFVEQWYDLPLFRSLHRHPHLLQKLKMQRKQNHPAWVAKVLQDLSPGHQPDGWPLLPSLALPVLLLSGVLDPKYPELCKKMHTLLPHSTLHISEQAGHNVHLEATEDWLTHVSRFLDTVWTIPPTPTSSRY